MLIFAPLSFWFIYFLSFYLILIFLSLSSFLRVPFFLCRLFILFSRYIICLAENIQPFYLFSADMSAKNASYWVQMIFQAQLSTYVSYFRAPDFKLSFSYISVHFQIFIHKWTNGHYYTFRAYCKLSSSNFYYLLIHFHFWRWTKSIIMNECPLVH